MKRIAALLALTLLIPICFAGACDLPSITSNDIISLLDSDYPYLEVSVRGVSFFESIIILLDGEKADISDFGLNVYNALTPIQANFKTIKEIRISHINENNEEDLTFSYPSVIPGTDYGMIIDSRSGEKISTGLKSSDDLLSMFP